LKGRVLRSTGSWYTLLTNDNQIVEGRLKGKLRLDAAKATNPITVGDIVLLEPEQGSTNKVLIVGFEPRNNYIMRASPRKKHHDHVIAANLDQAALVVTLSQPRTSTGFIDRFLVTAEMYHIPTVLVFNKHDLLTSEEAQLLDDFTLLYKYLGYTCLVTSASTQHGLDLLAQQLEGKTTLLSGHSGVGKSSLINSLFPNLNLRTNELSGFSGKGMHTTTFAEMHPLPAANGGGFIVDTPGIKEFGIVHLEPEELSHYFVEMRQLLLNCRYNNCLHRNEPGCAVKQALEEGQIADSRYLNYVNILDDIEEQNYWER
jgi:ribosome biogenesis GTPase